MSHPKEKIDAAIRMLKAQGHTVKTQVRDDKFWFEVDRRMLVSWEEMQNLADGVYSLAELEELFRRRRAEGAGERADELAQEVVNTCAAFASAGHAADLTADFKVLVDWACEYQSAKRNADNRRNTFQLVRHRTNDPDSVLDALLEQAASQERAARDVFVKAYKDYWEKDRQREASGDTLSVSL